MSDRHQRALGALYGLAIGDALGMPTQSLPRSVIVDRYGEQVTGFEPGPADHPLAAGLPAGSITDDTEQALLVAGLLVDGGDRSIDPLELANRLLAWEESMHKRGSLDLLGPSTRRALADLLAGADVNESGRTGTTNGAAMRITPVGIVSPSADLDRLVTTVVQASSVTHNTSIGLAGAAAVAGAVSAGVDGAGIAQAIEVGIAAAERASRHGHWVAGADVAERIRWAIEVARSVPPDGVMDVVYRLICTSLSTQESVPAAFAVLASYETDPWLACRVAASVGGDCDTIAAMTGAMAGACSGAAAFPASARTTVTEVNGLDLDSIAVSLLRVRDTGAGTNTDRIAGVQQPSGIAPAGRLLHTGNVVIDVVLEVDALPEPGDDVVTDAALSTAGGGFNVMLAAARQGMLVTYLGAHGSGPFGQLARRALSSAGVTVSQLPRRDLDTGIVLSLIDGSGERTFVTSRGAEATMQAADLQAVPVGADDVIYISGYSLLHEPNRAALSDWLVRLDDRVLVVFDPGPLVGDLPAAEVTQVLRRADWVTCNQRESGRLTGQQQPSVAGQHLLRRCPRGSVLIRLGADGCVLIQRGAEPIDVPAFTVAAVDTNGAGDAHTGTFIAALSRGEPAPNAARLANAAAAFAVTVRGPATAPTGAQLRQFLADAGDQPGTSTLNAPVSMS
ncbi:MAG: ADP-ribosylglycohydrolase [Frankiales bacterium]|nr:ADP-ribosylglycohydrolase [Frankiales bacterium]